jgi:hypothetical protein
MPGSGRLLIRGALIVLSLLTILVLASCGSGGGPAPAATSRPTSTTEAVKRRDVPVQRPTATTATELIDIEEDTPTPEQVFIEDTPTPEEIVFEDTPTPEEIVFEDTPTPEVIVENTPTVEVFVEDTPTPEESIGDDGNVYYELYEADEGGWSIEYPDTWQVNEAPPNIQFLEPNGEAFIQVTYSPVDEASTNEDLATLTSEQFAQTFGESYVEVNREEQADGSYRLDFGFEVSGIPWVAQVFVEQRGDGVYLLMLATSKSETRSDYYDAIFDYVIQSYKVLAQ